MLPSTQATTKENSVSNGTATPKTISTGQLTVTKNADAYTLGGVVWFEDES